MARALMLNARDGELSASVEEIAPDRLPEGDVLVSVLFSSLNYKDALAVTGRGKIVRGAYPFVPGIDLVGRVEEPTGPFAPGDIVIGTGWGIGESRWGGYSRLQRLEGAHLVPLPKGMEPLDAMVIGTAGFTAMLSVMALEEHGAEPDGGGILVTGASGGVGSMGVALLAASGFRVAASTGSPDAHDYLRELGADEIIDRAELDEDSARPMESARWAGAVDVVGGKALASVIRQLQRHASVAACGLAGGHELNTTVYPFILRGVNLLGIDSNTCPQERRITAWERLSDTLPSDALRRMTSQVISLEDVPDFSRRLLDGKIRGRIVVDVDR